MRQDDINELKSLNLQILSAPPAVSSVVIQSGQSLSAAIDLAEQRLHRINVPGNWTTAGMTFQVSHDDVTYYDLYNESGEYALAAGAAVAGKSVVVDAQVFFGARYLKIRSGTAGAPVAQTGGNKTITLVTVPR